MDTDWNLVSAATEFMRKSSVQFLPTQFEHNW